MSAVIGNSFLKEENLVKNCGNLSILCGMYGTFVVGERGSTFLLPPQLNQVVRVNARCKITDNRLQTFLVQASDHVCTSGGVD